MPVEFEKRDAFTPKIDESNRLMSPGYLSSCNECSQWLGDVYPGACDILHEIGIERGGDLAENCFVPQRISQGFTPEQVRENLQAIEKEIDEEMSKIPIQEVITKLWGERKKYSCR
jgi:predicted RNase H-like HicB family nuclease